VPDRFTSRWDTLAFVGCLLVSMIARVTPEPIQTRVASAVRGSLLAPLLAVQRQAELFKTSRARSAALVTQRDDAARSALDIESVREENLRLRRLLGLHERLSVPHVSAEVLHQSSPVDGLTLLLAAGSDAGVRPMSPILTPDGLLGVVRSVDRDHAVAVIWPHPDFRAGAMTEDGEAFGIVAPSNAGGRGRLLLELHGVPYLKVLQPGTRLYTAGFGEVYPRGIPIGRVLAIADETVGLARSYLVEPAAHPASVAHVIILLRPRGDLADAFVEPGS